MRPVQWATLVLRLLGVYFICLAIPAVSLVITGLISAYGDGANGHGGTARSGSFPLLLPLISFALRMAVGVVLLVWSKRLGERLAPKEIGGENPTTISFENAQVLAFAVLGVLVFADALPGLFRSIYTVVSWIVDLANGTPVRSGYMWNTGMEALGLVAQAGLGLWLFFRAQRFARFWRSQLPAGTPPPSIQ